MVFVAFFDKSVQGNNLCREVNVVITRCKQQYADFIICGYSEFVQVRTYDFLDKFLRQWHFVPEDCDTVIQLFGCALAQCLLKLIVFGSKSDISIHNSIIRQCKGY